MNFQIKNYREAVIFLESLSNIGSSEGRTKKESAARLENLRCFLSFLGKPGRDLKIIHLAGTSGKGSTAMMLHYIFFAAGKKAGTYISPHTTTFCERIKVGGKYISEKDLVELVNFLKRKMDAYVNQKIKKTKKQESINFFEAAFCLALLYFKKMGCEYAVIETACGGRYDATNIIENPVYTIITNIGFDHRSVLGRTLEQIARHKAGIIKPKAPVLTGEGRGRILKIFNAECRMKNTKLKEINYQKIKNIKISLNGTNFEYQGEKYKLSLLGGHQARNAVLAIECAKDLGVPPKTIKKGLLKIFYPARLEIMSKKPLIILDGAHNEDKLKATMEFIRTSADLNQSVKRNQRIKRKYLIMAAAKNKEIKKVMPKFEAYFDDLYLTRFSYPFRKCYGPADWQKMFSATGRKKLRWRHRPQDALLDILPKLGNNDLLLIMGSIFLAGELRQYWYREEDIIKSQRSNIKIPINSKIPRPRIEKIEE